MNHAHDIIIPHGNYLWASAIPVAIVELCRYFEMFATPFTFSISKRKLFWTSLGNSIHKLKRMKIINMVSLIPYHLHQLTFQVSLTSRMARVKIIIFLNGTAAHILFFI